MEAGLASEGDTAEELVRAVVAERVHERAGADVAVGPGERRAVQVPGAAGEGERPVDDAGRGVADERLGRLSLGEQRRQLLVRPGRRRVGLVMLVDRRGRAREDRTARSELDRALRDEDAVTAVAVR